MFKRILLQTFFCLQLSLITAFHAQAQCTTANLKWDNLEYLVTTGNYSGYVTTAMALTQNFAFGTNRLTVAAASTNITLNGANNSHTGESGSYGTGVDVQFTTTTTSARTIVLTFDAEVSTFKMSIYDLDASQRVTVSAKNAANTAKSVTLSKPSGGTVTLASNPGNTPTGTGNSTNYGNTVNTATLNIDIAGPVKTITLSFDNAAGDFWISDMSACVTGSFPNSYYIVSKPFTGMPGYVLTVVDNDFYCTNTANGVSKYIFTEPANNYVNSYAYDPYNRFIYYTYSLTGSPATDNAIKKYDVNTGTISTILSDVTTLGIPTYEYGVESGAAAFYDGSLYLGIEGYGSSFNKSRKSIVWRIDFNGSNVPYRASQVYGSLSDNGSGSLLHDWSDIGCSNGILYDFDGAASDPDFYLYNMQTGALTNYTPASGVVPRQAAVGWDEKIYNIDGTITQYNGTNGHTGSSYTITSTPAIPGGGSWGDGAEAFRPFLDFGDAPSTYDPAAGDPAVHDSSGSTLRIGANVNVEWLKRGITSTEDTYDDGIASVQFLNKTAGTYLAQVSVYNNTGSNATLIGWLDYNANGVFNTGEGVSITVGSSASMQSKYLYWSGISTPLANGSYTYLRIRLTSSSNGMTTANPTGYYSNGEVEDYKVRVDNYPLAVSLLSFDARKTTDKKVKLDWSAVNEDANMVAYDIERSNDGINWTHFEFVTAIHSTGNNSYELTDNNPYKGISYYRLKLGDGNTSRYSDVRSVNIEDFTTMISLWPNPASQQATIRIYNNDVPDDGEIKVVSMDGKILFSQKIMIRQGENPVNLPLPSSWPQGMYMIQVRKGEEITNKKLLIKH